MPTRSWHLFNFLIMLHFLEVPAFADGGCSSLFQEGCLTLYLVILSPFILFAWILGVLSTFIFRRMKLVKFWPAWRVVLTAATTAVLTTLTFMELQGWLGTLESFNFKIIMWQNAIFQIVVLFALGRYRKKN